MGEVSLNIHGKTYSVACDDGQEPRVAALGKYVDGRLREIAAAGAASNESHLLVLTALLLADEMHDVRESLDNVARTTRVSKTAEEDQMVEAIDHLALRIDSVARRIQQIQ